MPSTKLSARNNTDVKIQMSKYRRPRVMWSNTENGTIVQIFIRMVRVDVMYIHTYKYMDRHTHTHTKTHFA